MWRDEYALIVDLRESLSSFVYVFGAKVNNLYDSTVVVGPRRTSYDVW